MKNLEKIAIDWAYTQETHAKPTDAVTAYMAGYKHAVSQMQAENARLTQALSRAGYANARLREALAAITAQFEKADRLYSRDRDIIAQAKEVLAK